MRVAAVQRDRKLRRMNGKLHFCPACVARACERCSGTCQAEGCQKACECGHGGVRRLAQDYYAMGRLLDPVRLPEEDEDPNQGLPLKRGWVAELVRRHRRVLNRLDSHLGCVVCRGALVEGRCGRCDGEPRGTAKAWPVTATVLTSAGWQTARCEVELDYSGSGRWVGLYLVTPAGRLLLEAHSCVNDHPGGALIDALLDVIEKEVGEVRG